MEDQEQWWLNPSLWMCWKATRRMKLVTFWKLSSNATINPLLLFLKGLLFQIVLNPFSVVVEPEEIGITFIFLNYVSCVLALPVLAVIYKFFRGFSPGRSVFSAGNEILLWSVSLLALGKAHIWCLYGTKFCMPPFSLKKACLLCQYNQVENLMIVLLVYQSSIRCPWTLISLANLLI